jgi:hypothetical protein
VPLQSDTDSVKTYEFKIGDVTFIVFDTPGFSDTFGNDSSNAVRIARALDGVDVDVLLYLDRFSEPRFGELDAVVLKKYNGVLGQYTGGRSLWDNVAVVLTRGLDEVDDFATQQRSRGEAIKDGLRGAVTNPAAAEAGIERMPVAVYDGKHPAARLPHGHSSLAAVLQAVCDVVLRPGFARLQFRIPIVPPVPGPTPKPKPRRFLGIFRF